MNFTSGLSLPTEPLPLKRLVAATVLVLSLVVGATVQPASGVGVTVGPQPLVLQVCCVFDKPVTITLGLPVGAELTSEEVQALLAQVTDFILAKEAALVDELVIILNEAEEILRILKDTVQFIIIPFLEDTLDTLVGLVVLVKENVFNVCVTIDADFDPVVCTNATP